MSRPRVCPFVASAEARIRRLRRMLVLMLIVGGVGGRPIPTYAQAAAPIDGFFASQLLVDAGYEQNHVIYAVGTAGGCSSDCVRLLRSRDGGHGWERASATRWTSGQLVSVAIGNASVLVSAGQSGVLVSTDQGDNFEAVGA